MLKDKEVLALSTYGTSKEMEKKIQLLGGRLVANFSENKTDFVFSNSSFKEEKLHRQFPKKTIFHSNYLERIWESARIRESLPKPKINDFVYMSEEDEKDYYAENDLFHDSYYEDRALAPIIEKIPRDDFDFLVHEDLQKCFHDFWKTN